MCPKRRGLKEGTWARGAPGRRRYPQGPYNLAGKSRREPAFLSRRLVDRRLCRWRRAERQHRHRSPRRGQGALEAGKPSKIERRLRTGPMARRLVPFRALSGLRRKPFPGKDRKLPQKSCLNKRSMKLPRKPLTKPPEKQLKKRPKRLSWTPHLPSLRLLVGTFGLRLL